MNDRLPLQGLRIHLSGSVPEYATEAQTASIREFVERFARAVLRDGGVLIHGSHPSFQQPLRIAASAFVSAGGGKDSLILVRAQRFAVTEEHFKEIEAERAYATVEVVPANSADVKQSLIPMRIWMAERSDVIVAIGGRSWEVNKSSAGVPEELEEVLGRGKPGFVLGSFGGAVAGYLRDHEAVFSRLRNGLSSEENHGIASSTDVTYLVSTDNCSNSDSASDT